LLVRFEHGLTLLAALLCGLLLLGPDGISLLSQLLDRPISIDEFLALFEALCFHLQELLGDLFVCLVVGSQLPFGALQSVDELLYFIHCDVCLVAAFRLRGLKQLAAVSV
jgi:hypothetical protein